ncbi:unnamed protein product [Aphanomyces euteiches]
MHDIILNREPSASEIQAVERSKDLSLKLSAIENDRNFVYLPKEQTWLNAKVQRPVDRSEVPKDFFFSMVNQPDKFEAFRFYGHKSKNSTLAWVQFGAALCGGREVVHGGCLATVFDELFGNTVIWVLDRAGFTATLTVHYRRRFLADQAGIFITHVEKNTGRKVFMKARLEGLDGLVYAEATSLFVLIDPPSSKL